MCKALDYANKFMFYICKRINIDKHMFMSFIFSGTFQPYTYVPALCKIRNLAVYTSIVETVNRHDLILI